MGIVKVHQGRVPFSAELTVVGRGLRDALDLHHHTVDPMRANAADVVTHVTGGGDPDVFPDFPRRLPIPHSFPSVKETCAASLNHPSVGAPVPRSPPGFLKHP